MEKTISWRAPAGDEDHEIPDGAAVTFRADEDRELKVEYMEDNSILLTVKSKSMEFAQAYFVPEPETVSFDEVLEKAKGIKLYTHKMVPDGKPFESKGEIAKYAEEGTLDVKEAVTIASCFPAALILEGLQQVYSPIFAVEESNGKVIHPDDPRMEAGREEEAPKFRAEKAILKTIATVEYVSLPLPGSDEMHEMVKGVVETLVTQYKWNYLYYIEVRGDGDKTYLYARGC